ncbi:putative pumilio homolog 8, chloroplastic [Gastrolobium bilobum]|uniref:putative pumilio homolog 8, chloroplastic n=1 Tax=Gastrolobium bilobum TaxID=150636 RepID=UPI002AB24C8E|nr:putative pumilio homolog 8, chloroplastic [Gastrolobium bilobum]
MATQNKNSNSPENNPFYLDPNESPVLVPISPPLNGRNFHTWLRDMKDALRSENKLAFVDGTITVPELNDPSYVAWEKCNTMVVSWLQHSISDTILQSVLRMDKAEDILKDLQERFSHFRILDLHDDTLKVQQGTKAVEEYFNELKSLWDEFDSLQPMPECQCQPACSCGGVLLNQIKNRQERDRVIRFLKGLNQEQFSHVCSQVMMIDPLPGIHEVLSLVSEQERCLNHDYVNVNQNEPQAFDQPESSNKQNDSSGRGPSNSLAEARGRIDSLKRMIDEGTPGNDQYIFNETITHVVELMMDPSGNYLVQKLLCICNEEQRTQIIRKKLIETLETGQQISLVVSALRLGLLALIKDLNGNHVVQDCLKYLRNEDIKFIFAVATTDRVEIATDQHGCRVLQRCIRHSSGEHREKLVAEICANAYLLAQKQFGNFVVQFILDLRIASVPAISWQFDGKYVHLSMQKFSSHVVQKCLEVFDDENRSTIIYELVCSGSFEKLLRDPHENYVVQLALRHSEGPMHDYLVQEILYRKGILRNCRFSRNILSRLL